MRKGSSGFTLIEVMLAVAIFALAAVGFAKGLNDILGLNVEMVRTAQRRQAVESLAAKILAASNNLVDQGSQWQTVEKFKTWSLEQSVQAPEPIALVSINNTRLVGGWMQVRIQAVDKNKERLDAVSFLLWPQR